jgi:hypothetical protein
MFNVQSNPLNHVNPVKAPSGFVPLVPLGGSSHSRGLVVRGWRAVLWGFAGGEIVFRRRESSRKMHDRTSWDGWDGSWDGLGRQLGRIKCAKSPMFIGLGTMVRINWGGEEGINTNLQTPGANPDAVYRGRESDGPSAKMASALPKPTCSRSSSLLARTDFKVSARAIGSPATASFGRRDRRCKGASLMQAASARTSNRTAAFMRQQLRLSVSVAVHNSA